MYCVFYKTNDVFLCEEMLLKMNISVEVVPTPVQDKAYCGVCLRVNSEEQELVDNILSGFEYRLVM